MATWQKLSLTVHIWQLGKGLGKSSPCLHAVYCLFLFCQVRNRKLLEIELVFTWQIVLRVGKSQDLSSRIWQTLGDALSIILPSPLVALCILIASIAHTLLARAGFRNRTVKILLGMAGNQVFEERLHMTARLLSE